MAYIGKAPPTTGKDAGASFDIDDVSSNFNGSTTAFAIEVGGESLTPTSTNVFIFLGGVLQHPGDAYTISGSNIAFTAAPESGTSFHGTILGHTRTITPDQGTVGDTSFASSAGTAISGSFTAVSSSLASRITSEESDFTAAGISGSITATSSSIATRFDSRETDMTLATASIAAITSSISRLDDTESNMTLATASIAAITSSISRLDTETETNESNITLATASIAAITSSVSSIRTDMTLATASIAAITASVSTLKSNVGQELNTDSDVQFADITSTGTITAVEVHTTYVSSSISVASGSNNFGDDTSDHHSFTGSVSISSSLSVTESISTNKVQALTGEGLQLYEDGGNGIFIEDGGQVGIGTSSPGAPLHIASTDEYMVGIENNDGNNEPAAIRFIKNGDSPATNDQIGQIEFWGENASNETEERARIAVTQKSIANGSEDSVMLFNTSDSGTVATRLAISGSYIGIGTTNPTDMLTIDHTGDPWIVIKRTNGSAQINKIGTDSAGLYLQSYGHATGGNNQIVFMTTGSNSATSADVRMSIEADGNVGIGVTAPKTDLEVGGADGAHITLSHTPTNASDIADNDLLGQIDFAGYDTDYSGDFVIGARIRAQVDGTWDASGGGNTADAPTELQFITLNSDTSHDVAHATNLNMVIKSDGKIGMGTDSPGGLLSVYAGNQTSHANAASGILIGNGTGADCVGQVGFGPNGGTNPAAYYGYLQTDAGGNTNGALILSTRSGTGDDLPSERMRITSAGKVVIGSTATIGTYGAGRPVLTIKSTADGSLNQYSTIQLNGETIDNAGILGTIDFYDGTNQNALVRASRASSTTTADIEFFTSPGSGLYERMNIGSDGECTIGTSAKSRLRIQSGDGASGAFKFTSGVSNENVYLNFYENDFGTQAFSFMFDTGGSQVFYIKDADDTTLVSIGQDDTDWTQGSDERIKKNITTIDSGLSKIKSLRGVNYKWNAKSKKSDTESNRLGFIAQELKEVIPEAVVLRKSPEHEGTELEDLYGVQHNCIIPVLVEAIKELSAKVEALENA